MLAKDLIYTNQNDLVQNEISNDPNTIILKPIYENVNINKITTLPDINNESNYLYNNNTNVINYEQNGNNQTEDPNNIDYNDYNSIITNPSSSITQITNYVNMMHNKTMTYEDASNFKNESLPFKKAQNSNEQLNPQIKKVININSKVNKNEINNNVIELPPRKEKNREIKNDNNKFNVRMIKKLPNIEILNNDERQSNPIYKTMNLQQSRLNLNNDKTVNNTNNNIENNELNNTEIIKINRSTQTEEPKIDYNISIVPVDDLKNKLLRKREKTIKNRGFHGVKAIKVYSPKSNSNFNYNLNDLKTKSYKDIKNNKDINNKKNNKNNVDDLKNRSSNYSKYNNYSKKEHIVETPTKKIKVISYINKENKNEFSPSKRFIVDYGRKDNNKNSKPKPSEDKRAKEKNYRYSDYHSKANLSNKYEFETPKKSKRYIQNKKPLYYNEVNIDLLNGNQKKVRSNKNKRYHTYINPKKEERPLYYYEKNNDDLDEYDNNFNTHEKFINKMKNLFDF